jgi:hypothetical protein
VVDDAVTLSEGRAVQPVGVDMFAGKEPRLVCPTIYAICMSPTIRPEGLVIVTVGEGAAPAVVPTDVERTEAID